MRKWRHLGEAGFSLVELLFVLVIMAILASAARPLLLNSAKRSQELQLRSALKQIRSAIDDYKHATEGGRIAVPATGTGYPPNLKSLVEGVSDLRSPLGKKIYFLRYIPRDPFADASTPAEETWRIRPSDADPGEYRVGVDVFDVASMSEKIALNGSMYRDW